MSFAATCMDLQKSDKDKYHIISLMCGIKKNSTDESICKTEIESQM